MKKQLIGLTVLSSLVLGMTAAHAAPPTAELKVIGTLTVPSCTVASPDEGVYDFGKLSSSLVKSGTATTALTPMTKTWTVTCDA
ncbi:fimbrial assembly protein, partial [Yersinia enterocolitica]